MDKIAFIGAGSFGTSLSLLLANKGYEVSLWDRSKEVVDDININRKNSRYLEDLEIPKKCYSLL